MRMTLRTSAIAAIVTMAASSGAWAQYICPPGYTYAGGVCQPLAPPSYSNPLSGALTGEAAGAAQGNATGGPIGAVIGGAIGTATGAVSGAANLLAPPPQHVCPPGYTIYMGTCYPAR